MSHTSALAKYLKAIEVTLEAALCVRNFASQLVERHNKPEVEVAQNKELLLQPVVVSRSPLEKTLIEGSVNSVRVSIKIKQNDDLEVRRSSHTHTAYLQYAECGVYMRMVYVCMCVFDHNMAPYFIMCDSTECAGGQVLTLSGPARRGIHYPEEEGGPWVRPLPPDHKHPH
jgi:hypothetical protein